MGIAVLGIVVDVSRVHVRFHGFERLRNLAHHVRMTGVEADADVIKMRRTNELDQPVWRGEFVRYIFDQDPNAKGLRERAQVLYRRHRRLELSLVVALVRQANMLDEEAKRDLLPVQWHA